MRKLLSTLFSAVALLLPYPLLAQAPQPKVAVINILRAIVECGEGKQANEAFQKKYELKRDELAKKQSELQSLQQQLGTQGATMTEEARATLSRSLDQKSVEFQRAQDDAEKEFTNLRNEIFTRIGAKLTPIVQQYSKEKNFTILFDSSNQSGQLFYANPALDITDDIIKLYDGSQVSKGGTPPPASKPPVNQGSKVAPTSQPSKTAGAAGKSSEVPPKKN
ncbi:MAG: OmpH family outer membrane protein [Terriglobia bacterium]